MAPIAARNNTNKNNNNVSVKHKLRQMQRANTDISYMLYLHREELRKRKPSFMRKAYTKLQLTHELIRKNVRNCDKRSYDDDLLNISRQIIFKSKLRRLIARVEYYQTEKYQIQLTQQLKKQQLQPQENNNLFNYSQSQMRALNTLLR